MKEVTVKLKATYKDGGTRVYKDKEGNTYFEDRRIRTNTKGSIFDKYPDKKNAKILEIKLIVE